MKMKFYALDGLPLIGEVNFDIKAGDTVTIYSTVEDRMKKPEYQFIVASIVEK